MQNSLDGPRNSSRAFTEKFQGKISIVTKAGILDALFAKISKQETIEENTLSTIKRKDRHLIVLSGQKTHRRISQDIEKVPRRELENIRLPSIAGRTSLSKPYRDRYSMHPNNSSKYALSISTKYYTNTLNTTKQLMNNNKSLV